MKSDILDQIIIYECLKLLGSLEKQNQDISNIITKLTEHFKQESYQLVSYLRSNKNPGISEYDHSRFRHKSGVNLKEARNLYIYYLFDNFNGIKLFRETYSTELKLTFVDDNGKEDLSLMQHMTILLLLKHSNLEATDIKQFQEQLSKYNTIQIKKPTINPINKIAIIYERAVQNNHTKEDNLKKILKEEIKKIIKEFLNSNDENRLDEFFKINSPYHNIITEELIREIKQEMAYTELREKCNDQVTTEEKNAAIFMIVSKYSIVWQPKKINAEYNKIQTTIIDEDTKRIWDKYAQESIIPQKNINPQEIVDKVYKSRHFAKCMAWTEYLKRHRAFAEDICIKVQNEIHKQKELFIEKQDELNEKLGIKFDKTQESQEANDLFISGYLLCNINLKKNFHIEKDTLLKPKKMKKFFISILNNVISPIIFGILNTFAVYNIEKIILRKNAIKMLYKTDQNNFSENQLLIPARKLEINKNNIIFNKLKKIKYRFSNKTLRKEVTVNNISTKYRKIKKLTNDIEKLTEKTTHENNKKKYNELTIKINNLKILRTTMIKKVNDFNIKHLENNAPMNIFPKHTLQHHGNKT